MFFAEAARSHCLAFPMATLLAALMTCRLSSDSELIALRSCGVSIYRLVLPAFILSFVVTGMIV